MKSGEGLVVRAEFHVPVPCFSFPTSGEKVLRGWDRISLGLGLTGVTCLTNSQRRAV